MLAFVRTVVKHKALFDQVPRKVYLATPSSKWLLNLVAAKLPPPVIVDDGDSSHHFFKTKTTVARARLTTPQQRDAYDWAVSLISLSVSWDRHCNRCPMCKGKASFMKLFTRLLEMAPADERGPPVNPRKTVWHEIIDGISQIIGTDAMSVVVPGGDERDSNRGTADSDDDDDDSDDGNDGSDDGNNDGGSSKKSPSTRQLKSVKVEEEDNSDTAIEIDSVSPRSEAGVTAAQTEEERKAEEKKAGLFTLVREITKHIDVFDTTPRFCSAVRLTQNMERGEFAAIEALNLPELAGPFTPSCEIIRSKYGPTAARNALEWVYALRALEDRWRQHQSRCTKCLRRGTFLQFAVKVADKYPQMKGVGVHTRVQWHDLRTWCEGEVDGGSDIEDKIDALSACAITENGVIKALKETEEVGSTATSTAASSVTAMEVTPATENTPPAIPPQRIPQAAPTTAADPKAAWTTTEMEIATPMVDPPTTATTQTAAMEVIPKVPVAIATAPEAPHAVAPSPASAPATAETTATPGTRGAATEGNDMDDNSDTETEDETTQSAIDQEQKGPINGILGFARVVGKHRDTFKATPKLVNPGKMALMARAGRLDDIVALKLPRLEYSRSQQALTELAKMKNEALKTAYDWSLMYRSYENRWECHKYVCDICKRKKGLIDVFLPIAVKTMDSPGTMFTDRTSWHDILKECTGDTEHYPNMRLNRGRKSAPASLVVNKDKEQDDEESDAPSGTADETGDEAQEKDEGSRSGSPEVVPSSESGEDGSGSEGDASDEEEEEEEDVDVALSPAIEPKESPSSAVFTVTGVPAFVALAAKHEDVLSKAALLVHELSSMELPSTVHYGWFDSVAALNLPPIRSPKSERATIADNRAMKRLSSSIEWAEAFAHFHKCWTNHRLVCDACREKILPKVAGLQAAAMAEKSRMPEVPTEFDWHAIASPAKRRGRPSRGAAKRTRELPTRSSVSASNSAVVAPPQATEPTATPQKRVKREAVLKPSALRDECAKVGKQLRDAGQADAAERVCAAATQIQVALNNGDQAMLAMTCRDASNLLSKFSN